MKKLDMRKLDKQTRFELKQIAVSAVLSVGSRNISKVSTQYKLRRKTLFDWVNAYKKGGKKALSKNGRGANGEVWGLIC